MTRLVHRLLLPLPTRKGGELAVRFGTLIVGLVLYGAGIALMIRAHIGVAPWDVLSLGIERFVPISFGAITLLVSFVVLLLWLPLRERMGVGTLTNALLVGPSADVVLLLVPVADGVLAQGLRFIMGLVVLAIATGIYIGAGLGPGPRDGLMTALVRVTGRPVWLVRTVIEGSVLLVGFLLGGPVGIGTLAFAFGVGPLVGLTLPLFASRPKREATSSGEGRVIRRKQANDPRRG